MESAYEELLWFFDGRLRKEIQYLYTLNFGYLSYIFDLAMSWT